MARKKLIFLDIDGVLNSAPWFKSLPRPVRPIDMERFDPDTVKQLNRITQATGADIVISSSWRRGRSIRALADILDWNGVSGKVIGKTPILNTERGLEIQNWLDGAPSEYAFVILDDETDMGDLMDRLVQTSFVDGGLLPKHANQAIRMLNEG